jgi:hypothetical protein
MRELRSGIPSKITNTTGAVIDGPGKSFGGYSFLVPNPFPVCPILAEKTVKRASVIKHGEVLIPVLWV